jgi:hypothetical protein
MSRLSICALSCFRETSRAMETVHSHSKSRLRLAKSVPKPQLELQPQEFRTGYRPVKSDRFQGVLQRSTLEMQPKNE